MPQDNLHEDRATLELAIRDECAALLGNHFSRRALADPRRMLSGDIVVNVHMVDRVGALLTALVARGYVWDGYERFVAVHADAERKWREQNNMPEVAGAVRGSASDVQRSKP